MIDDKKKSKHFRRQDIRSQVTPLEIKGLLTNVDTQGHTPLIIWDISDQGMRLWVTNKLKAGERIKVTIARPTVITLNCEVRWCRTSGDQPGFHVGVKVLDHISRLESLHRLIFEESGEILGKVEPA